MNLIRCPPIENVCVSLMLLLDKWSLTWMWMALLIQVVNWPDWSYKFDTDSRFTLINVFLSVFHFSFFLFSATKL